MSLLEKVPRTRIQALNWSLTPFFVTLGRLPTGNLRVALLKAFMVRITCIRTTWVYFPTIGHLNFQFTSDLQVAVAEFDEKIPQSKTQTLYKQL